MIKRGQRVGRIDDSRRPYQPSESISLADTALRDYYMKRGKYRTPRQREADRSTTFSTYYRRARRPSSRITPPDSGTVLTPASDPHRSTPRRQRTHCKTQKSAVSSYRSTQRFSDQPETCRRRRIPTYLPLPQPKYFDGHRDQHRQQDATALRAGISINYSFVRG